MTKTSAQFRPFTPSDYRKILTQAARSEMKEAGFNSCIFCGQVKLLKDFTPRIHDKTRMTMACQACSDAQFNKYAGLPIADIHLDPEADFYWGNKLPLTAIASYLRGQGYTYNTETKRIDKLPVYPPPRKAKPIQSRPHGLTTGQLLSMDAAALAAHGNRLQLSASDMRRMRKAWMTAQQNQ